MRVITIGRSEENDAVIRDSHASRHHLQIIQHDDGHYTLADFGSTNGTYINGQKISGEVYLNKNDVVRIGNSTIPWRTYFENSESVASVAPGAGIPFYPAVKERHGFVTFWLWLMILGNDLGVVYGVLSSQHIYESIRETSRVISENPEAYNIESGVLDSFNESANLHADILLICTLLSAVCSIVFVIFIMKWKKVGFWFWSGTVLVFGTINVILTNLFVKDFASLNLSMDLGIYFLIMLIMIPIVILVLWAILQIKKNGISCWKLLE